MAALTSTLVSLFVIVVLGGTVLIGGGAVVDKISGQPRAPTGEFAPNRSTVIGQLVVAAGVLLIAAIVYVELAAMGVF